MKWYSVKKYKPALEASLALLRIKKENSSYFYFDLGEWDDGWKDWVNKEPIEEDGFIVTHFCIPDPIALDDEE